MIKEKLMNRSKFTRLITIIGATIAFTLMLSGCGSKETTSLVSSEERTNDVIVQLGLDPDNISDKERQKVESAIAMMDYAETMYGDKMNFVEYNEAGEITYPSIVIEPVDKEKKKIIDNEPVIVVDADGEYVDNYAALAMREPYTKMFEEFVLTRVAPNAFKSFTVFDYAELKDITKAKDMVLEDFVGTTSTTNYIFLHYTISEGDAEILANATQDWYETTHLSGETQIIGLREDVLNEINNENFLEYTASNARNYTFKCGQLQSPMDGDDPASLGPNQ